MEEDDKQNTTFWCPIGFYEFNQMPQKIWNTLSSFWKVDWKVHKEHGILWCICVPRWPQGVCKLNSKKCQFVQPSVKFLGNVISAEGVQTEPAKISAVADWFPPQNGRNSSRYWVLKGNIGALYSTIVAYCKAPEWLAQITGPYVRRYIFL